MKRCPECRRDYYDDSILYCLDDGTALLEGPASGSDLQREAATAILHTTDPVGDAPTHAQTHTTNIPYLAGELSPTERRSFTKLVTLTAAILVLAAGFLGYRYLKADAQITSVAVMPFVNDSGNPENEYLSDGMTETLISTLSQIAGLNVKARSSVFRYKGTGTDAKTVGKDLGVQAVLNGRFVQRGEQLTLSLELIDAQNDNLIWGDKYDRKQSDLVNLQSEIARDVSNQLKLKLTSADQLKLAKKYTNDPEVYRLYLQGRYHWNKRTKSEVDKGVPFFEQAIEKDSNFALGYVGLADSNEDSDRPKKLEYIQRALVIDPDLAEAHASLGYQLMCKQDWAESERELKRAKELNPSYAQAYAWNGIRLTMIGKYDEALAEIDRGLAMEPTANGINFYKAVTLAVSGKGDAAINQFKRMQEMDPTFPWAHSFLARVYFWNGDLASSAEERARSAELDGKEEAARRLRQAFASGGWDAFAAESRAQGVGGFETVMGPVIAAKDVDKERLIANLQRRAEYGDFWLFLIKTEPTFDPIRDDPRFQEILKRFDPPQ